MEIQTKGEIKEVKRSGKTHAAALFAFRKQFKDVVKMTKIYINEEGKVYAGEWIDSKGVINFNGGFAPDIFMSIEFID